MTIDVAWQAPESRLALPQCIGTSPTGFLIRPVGGGAPRDLTADQLGRLSTLVELFDGTEPLLASFPKQYRVNDLSGAERWSFAAGVDCQAAARYLMSLCIDLDLKRDRARILSAELEAGSFWRRDPRMPSWRERLAAWRPAIWARLWARRAA